MERVGRSATEEEGDRSSVKRLKSSVAVEAFDCHVCARPLGPPIFECTEGHLFVCASCRDELPDGKCPSVGAGCAGALARSLGMERAVRAILLDCRYAGRGCAQRTAYHLKEEHETACPHAPCLCPEPGCGGFAGMAAELLDHLTGHHKWPSTNFSYWEPFDPLEYCRKKKPCRSHVLRCPDDGQLFLLSLRPAAEPPGLAVSLVCVPPYVKATRFGCTVSFSISISRPERISGTCTLDDLQTLRLSDWPPAECICVLPNVCYDEDEGWDQVVLTTTIVCAGRDPDNEDDDLDDLGFIASDEDEDDSS